MLDPARLICQGLQFRPSHPRGMQKPPPVYEADLVFHPERDTEYVHFEQSAAHPFAANPSGLPRVNAWWLAESALLTYWSEADASDPWDWADAMVRADLSRPWSPPRPPGPPTISAVASR